MDKEEIEKLAEECADCIIGCDDKTNFTNEHLSHIKSAFKIGYHYARDHYEGLTGAALISFINFCVDNFEDNHKTGELKKWRSVFDESINTTEQVFEKWKAEWKSKISEKGQ